MEHHTGVSGRALRRRLTRRATLVAGGATAFLAACGGGASKDTKSTSQATTAPAASSGGAQPQPAATTGAAVAAAQPKMGGTMRFPINGLSSANPPTIDPFENLTYLAQEPSAFHYSRLLRSTGSKDLSPDDQTKLVGDVAAKLPEQPDDVTYVFTIKPNVKFHDKPPMSGRTLTAKDIAATWNVFKTASQNQASFNGVIDRLEAPDEKTVKVTLKDAFAPFLVTHAASPEGLWLIPVETIDSGQVKKDPVGTGPWIFRQWETGVALRWDRNPAWFEAPAPYAAKLEVSLINDAQRILSALQAGDLDWSHLNGPLYTEAKQKLDPKGQDIYQGNPSHGGFYFNFDVKPWGDKRVRQALSMAMDREGYLKVQDGTKKGDYFSFVPPVVPPFYLSPRSNKAEFGPNARYFEKNIAESKKLLAAAGFPDGFGFKLTANIDRYGIEAKQLWELLAQTIPEAGFKPELNYQEYGAYIQSTFLGKITDGAAVGPWIGSPRDPDDIFSRLFASSSPRHNWGGTPIPEMPDIDARFTKQRKILDLQERIKEVHEIQRVMAESMLVVPYHASGNYSWAQPWLQNFYLKTGYAYPTESVAFASFTDERIKKG